MTIHNKKIIQPYQKIQPQNENKYFRIPYIGLWELSVLFSCSELSHESIQAEEE